MIAAARENDRGLKGCFGKASWKVALEPGRRTSVCRISTSRRMLQ